MQIFGVDDQVAVARLTGEVVEAESGLGLGVPFQNGAEIGVVVEQ
jgi:hypothetical protein